MKKIVCLLVILSAFVIGITKEWIVHAENTNDSTNVTVSAELNVVFQEDGTNAIGEFQVVNGEKLPLKITAVEVQECNGWELVPNDSLILADSKQISLKLDTEWLQKGQNTMNIRVPEQSTKFMQVEINRGAWTSDAPKETAFLLEVEYQFEQKEFQITFDGNGCEEVIPPMIALNSEEVQLPVLERFGYEFSGWKDQDGNVYQEILKMPVDDIVLTAQWVKTEAYAILSLDDYSLTFVRSAEPIKVNSYYNGKIVSSVYTGFESAVYKNYTDVPWLAPGEDYGNNIHSVKVEDPIRPISTELWFFCTHYCDSYDMSYLDTSLVTSMYCMFSSAASKITKKVVITGIANWNTSSVKNMSTLFRGAGQNAAEFEIDDISSWDTSNVENMQYMFHTTGMKASWKLDLSKWNVKKVSDHYRFNDYAEGKVLPPSW